MIEDKWLKILLTIVVAILVWATIMMTVTTFHTIKMDNYKMEMEADHDEG